MVKYNNNLRSHRFWQSHWLTIGLYSRVSDNITYIKAK